MPMLRRNAPKLLKTVAGQNHASREDHEDEDLSHSRAEEDVFADPLSSSDEAPAPPQPSRTAQTSGSASAKRERKVTQTKSTFTTSKKGKRAGNMVVPRTGSFEAGREDKVRRGGHAGKTEEEKENVTSVPRSSAAKRQVEEPIFAGMEYGATKRQRVVGSTKYGHNIHAEPVGYTRGKKATFGKRRKMKEPADYLDEMNNPVVDEKDQDSDTVLMLDPQLEELSGTADSSNTKSEGSHASILSAKPNLLASLGAYKQPSSSPTHPAEDSSNAGTPLSSQGRQNGHSLQNDLDDLEEDVAELSDDDQDRRCALCEQPVDSEFSADFYKYRMRTVRNQTIFCKEHKLRSARAEYQKRGYKEIDWAGLPGRIRELRPDMIKLLKNESGEESMYRRQHAARLQSGKAAALPSRRKDKKPEVIEKETYSDLPTSTGYYGPRGKRIMMETLTSDLSAVIREVAANDPVVGRSGFAVYLQAVLVPELTVLLVMQDENDCSQAEAHEIIAQSGELGALLHEEVEDEVAQGSDEERDRELELHDED